jgi:hypothetical protein
MTLVTEALILHHNQTGLMFGQAPFVCSFTKLNDSTVVGACYSLAPELRA